MAIAVTGSGSALIATDGSIKAGLVAQEFDNALQRNADWTQSPVAGRFPTDPVSGTSKEYPIMKGRHQVTRITRLSEPHRFAPNVSEETFVVGYPVKTSIDFQRSRTKDLEGNVDTSASDLKNAMAAVHRNQTRRLLFAVNSLAEDSGDEGDETKINIAVAGTWNFDTSLNPPRANKFTDVQGLNTVKVKRLVAAARATSILMPGERLMAIANELVWEEWASDPLMNHADRAGEMKAMMVNGVLDLRFNPFPNDLNDPLLYPNLSSAEFPLTTTSVTGGSSVKTFWVTEDAVKRVVPARVQAFNGQESIAMRDGTDALIEVYADRDEDVVKTRVFGFDNYVACRPQGVMVTTDLIRE